MSRRNQKPQHKPQQKPAQTPPRPTGPQGLGLKAFHGGNYSEAIRLWSELDQGENPAVRSAIAEAHFRRALSTRVSVAEALIDLRRALDLFPNEARFWYHLGLMLHRSDCLEEARQAYARAAELGLVRKGIGVVRALAELEVNPKLALDTLSWLTPETRSTLAPVSALLRGEPQAPSLPTPDPSSKTPTVTDPVTALWQGLNLLASGDASAAYVALGPPKGPRLPFGAEPIRAFYYGVAAALDGKPQVALIHWREMARSAPASAAARPPHLNVYISQIAAHGILALQQEGKWKEAIEEARRSAELAPGDPWLIQSVLVAANRLATMAKEAGDWESAFENWEIMRGILERMPNLGPLPPVLHNLAIACEALEEWEDAAQAWIALLNTLPRRGGRATKTPAPVPAGPSVEEKRVWIRRRILDNFKRADLPDEAIAYYKQAVKADPENMDLRLEMAGALVANDQTIAGRNEVQRILDKEPKNVEALVMLAEIHRVRDEDQEAEQVMRRVLEVEPNHVGARKVIRQLILERGIEAFNSGRHRQAREIYREGLQFAPNDPVLLVYLGQSELVLGREKEAQPYFEAALATGTPEGYVHMFVLYARAHKESEAREILRRAEETGHATFSLYLRLGTLCLTYIIAPPLPGARSRPPAPPIWKQLGKELIDKGLELAPDRIEALETLIEELGPAQAAITVVYARQLVELQPEEPEHYLDLAIFQGYNKDVAGAKKTLALAERLARKQGRKDLLEAIAELREDVASPMFAMMGYFSDFVGLED